MVSVRLESEAVSRDEFTKAVRGDPVGPRHELYIPRRTGRSGCVERSTDGERDHSTPRWITAIPSESGNYPQSSPLMGQTPSTSSAAGKWKCPDSKPPPDPRTIVVGHGYTASFNEQSHPTLIEQSTLRPLYVRIIESTSPLHPPPSPPLSGICACLAPNYRSKSHHMHRGGPRGPHRDRKGLTLRVFPTIRQPGPLFQIGSARRCCCGTMPCQRPIA